MSKFCHLCIYPKNLKTTNPSTGEPLQFAEDGDSCEVCQSLLNHPDYSALTILNENNLLTQELFSYLDQKKEVLYAYSGGLDSTATLFLLNRECQKRGVTLHTFTVDTGVKGKTFKTNANNVIRYLNLSSHWEMFDISQTLQNLPPVIEQFGHPLTTEQVYSTCFWKSVLPCGKLCNSILDNQYKIIMQKYGTNEIITGGDTPKLNKKGHYSIFWTKPNGLITLRGAAGFRLTKEINKQLIKENNIPWIYPKCGGYDTDCLIPGCILADQTDGKTAPPLTEIIQKFPIVVHYLAERARFGVINRTEALKQIATIDIASIESYVEMKKIAAKHIK